MKKKSLLLSIILVLISLIAGTMAWVTFRSKKTAMVLTIGDSTETTVVNITPYQLDTTIEPVQLYTDVDYITVTVNNTKSVPAVVGVYFRINSIDNALLDQGFKYAIEKSSDGNTYTLCTTCGGNFVDALSSNRMYILEESINPGTQYYRIYIYIDGQDNNNNIVGGSVDLELRAQIEESGQYQQVITNHNEDLVYRLNHATIASGDSITGSIIPATIDYRYYGINPNNYVCLDYDGQSTCPEKYLYRIIGIIRNDKTGDNELKLIKADILHDPSTGNNVILFEDNEWPDGIIQAFLEMYYAYSSAFNNNVRDMMSELRVYLGGSATVPRTSSQSYLMERGTTHLNGVTVSDDYGVIIYPSDYAYASKTSALNAGACSYSTNCFLDNWMPTEERTISPKTETTNTVFYIDEDGVLDTITEDIRTTIYPVISIKSSVVIDGGLGTLSNPYTIMIPTLYNVLKKASDVGTYATRYTGSHQDDFNGTRSTEEIYHWYADDDTEGTEIYNNKFNVVFADMCWQMIRTTDTGGVRLFYNGEPTITTVNGKTTYDCGTTRPGHIGGIRSTKSLSGSLKYASSYTVTGTGTNTRFTLVDSQTITVDSSNAATQIANIVANYPYTCGTTSDSCTSATNFYKVTGQSSGVAAYVYPSVQYYDNLGTSVFNSPSTSIARVGYMYNSSTLKTPSSFSMAAKSLTVSTSSSYLIGDSLINNSDGTISLSGNVTEVAGSTWSTDYGNYKNKFVCLPGYYNATTYVCSDNRTTNNVQAVGYITATTGTNMTYLPVYKYGNNIDLDSGSIYKLVGDGSTQNTLQYIYNWSATTTSNCFVNSTYYTNGNVSSCGYTSINYSHYTCFNLSGKCSTYYYINFTTTSLAYRTPITGGKYVSTDMTDTNNILYEMLYASNVNTTDSTIKGKIDTWYRDNLYTNYDSYIDDTVYCNDRTITSFGGWNPNGGSTANSNINLLFKECTVSSDLSCTNTTDKFSQANTSAQLTYKVGLMSSPELNLLNHNNARKAASIYWLSSPYNVSGINAGGRRVLVSGSFYSSSVSTAYGVRPSVSLNTGIGYSQGTGAMNDPYVVDAPPVNNR